ncbi:bifunctional protein IspD/ispF [Micromonospora endophytica]|nr:NTP transferase domain-containing protein [Micromonospora endophytica]RIW42216.1 bifunctional protein IspD/ispF [Micromonospora endophytica]
MGVYAALVLAGGAGRRMGGRDKPTLPVGGVPMRERVLAEVADASPRILVGPGPAPQGVRLTREVPPGGGPVAAIAAGLALLDTTTPVRLDTATPAALDTATPAVLDTATPAVLDTAAPTALDVGVPAVVVLAADLPLLTRSAVGELLRQLDEPPGVDGVCFVDGTGRRQTLCGVWRPWALRAAVDRLVRQRGGELAGAPLRELLAGLAVREVTWSGGGPPPWFDCDTERDVRRAEEWIR